LPARVTRTQGCREGVVLARVKRGVRTVSSRRVNVRRNCTYVASVRGRAGRNRIAARFLGNEVLSARSAATRTGAAADRPQAREARMRAARAALVRTAAPATDHRPRMATGSRRVGGRP